MLLSPAPRRARLARAATFALTALLLAACGDDSRGGDGPTPPATSRDTLVVAAAAAPAQAMTLDRVALSPAVRATDDSGLPLAGLPVSYAVVAGGGVVEQADTRTDARGEAHVDAWRLGASAGTNTLRVTVAGRGVTFDVPATLRPAAAWEWRFVAAPLGDPHVTGLLFHPQDDRRWYASSILQGLYVSEDAGATWRQALAGTGLNDHGMAIDPSDPRRVYAAVGPVLWASEDRGATWEQRIRLNEWVRSLTVGPDGTLYVAPQWPATATPGLYRSADGGRTVTHHPYGVAPGTQLLTWRIFLHPETGALYAANEIADHPQPYRPPMLRSRDGGATWEDVTGALPWHVLDMSHDAASGRLYALTEGAGLWASTDEGDTWSRVNQRFGLGFLVDPRRPDWIYFGTHAAWSTGGVHLSTDRGVSHVPLGLVGRTTAALVTNHAGTLLYAAVYGSGIWVAPIGDAAPR